jgi:hypothetical protein
MFLAYGHSTVDRSKHAATVSMEEMALEPAAELRVLQRITGFTPFVSPAYTLASGDQPMREEHPRTDELLDALGRAMDENRATREYGSGENVSVVPFLLEGAMNLKTGEIHAIKTHFRYAYNSVWYAGGIEARIGVGSDVQRVGISELSRFLRRLGA